MIGRNALWPTALIAVTMFSAGLFAAGCGSSRDGLFERSFEATSTGEVSVETLSWTGFADLRERMRQEQKVLVVNFWATWCVPCVEEFPELKRMQEEFWGDRVRLATISMDDPGRLEDAVRPFLFERQMIGARFFMGEDWPTEFAGLIDESWWGGIPETLVYAADGTLVTAMTGQRTFEEFEAAVQRALKR